MRALLLSGLSALALSLPIRSGVAAPVTFSGTDPGANSADPRPNSNAQATLFDAAASVLGTTSIITFEASPVGTFGSLSVAPGVTLTGTDYLGQSQTIRNSPITTPERLFGYNTTAGGANFAYVNAGTLAFSFATPVTAFGAYLSGVQLAGETIQFSDGTSETLTIPTPGTTGGVEFFGFTDAGRSISSITIVTPNLSNPSGDFIGVDDVRYTTTAVTTVPEPTTVTLLGLGVAGLMATRRRGHAVS